MGESRSDVSVIADTFTSSAHTYERRMGSATRSVAEYIAALISPLPPKTTLLDNACGTGAVTEEFLKIEPTAVIKAVDSSPGMTAIFQNTVPQRFQQSNIETAVMDGIRLQFRNETFDLSITNFGIFFFSDPVQGIREVYRTLKEGGTAVVSCWKYIGILPIFYEVQKLIKPITPIQSLPVFEKWMKKETLEGTMRLGGFSQVRVEEKEVYLFRNGDDDLIAGLVDNLQSTVGEKWSKEEKTKLGETTQRVLREQAEKLCVVVDGRKAVRMVAWVALAKKTGEAPNL